MDNHKRNIKEPKHPTNLEVFQAIQEKKRLKEIKIAVRQAKKMKKEGKLKSLSFYFKKI
jgi:hypothetical protein